MKEIRVEARVRNNILWHAIFDRHKSVSEFCKSIGLGNRQAEVGAFLNLKKHPLNQVASWQVAPCSQKGSGPFYFLEKYKIINTPGRTRTCNPANISRLLCH